MKDRVYIGRLKRSGGAIAPVMPLFERREDNGWSAFESARTLCPPKGTVELRGPLVTTLPDGAWLIFSLAPNEMAREMKVRATQPRRLVPILQIDPSLTPEAVRRLVVEEGLQGATAGECACRVGEERVVLLSMEQGEDGRWRASGDSLSALPVSAFDPGRLVDLREHVDGHALYEPAAPDPAGERLNWSRDDDYLRAIATALAGGAQKDIDAILTAVERRTDALRGSLSGAAGADAAVIEEIARSGALAERLRRDQAALATFKGALVADPSVQAMISKVAAGLVEAERPKLLAQARAQAGAEMAADRAAFVSETKALAAEIEAAEMTALEQRKAKRQAEIDAYCLDAKKKALERVDAQVAAARAHKDAELARLAAQADELRVQAQALEVREREAAALVAAREAELARLADQEATLIARIEPLAKSADGLSARGASAPPGHPRFAAAERERAVPLSAVWEEAAKLSILTEAGVRAVARLAALLSSGEVPIIHGAGADDLLEAAALLLSGGRLARMPADPTMVTYEDLWNRAGGTGPTVLGSAAAAANGATVLAVVTGADRSGARFWLPALAEARARAHLPQSLLLCATFDDLSSEEATVASAGMALVDATGAFAEAAAAVYPALAAKRASEPTFLEMGNHSVGAAPPLMLLSSFKGLSLSAALRLARLHASASAALGEADAQAFVREAASAMGAPGGAVEHKNTMKGAHHA